MTLYKDDKYLTIKLSKKSHEFLQRDDRGPYVTKVPLQPRLKKESRKRT